jgi:hypothetical protein
MPRPSVSRVVFVAVLVGLAVSPTVRAEVTATDDAIIVFNSRVFPKVLPRDGTAPVGISIEGRVKPKRNRDPAPLRLIELEIHKAAKLFRARIPQCSIAKIYPASTKRALAACGQSRIGYGRIRAEASFPGRERLNFDGRVLLFNGRLANRRPAILMHVFNEQPPSSYVFPFAIVKRRGEYGTVLTANTAIGRWSRITAFKLVVRKTFRHKGRQRGYFNASCPAPKGFRGGISPVVRARLSFADGTASVIPVFGACRVAS